MQSKVSIVVPCYNKERHIGAMLESVISQIWDNIELILVNDGSTDGTRTVIEEYAKKIRGRGFELVIVDQENQGVAAAVKEGLLRITGEYICQVDSDDEILPEYVSMMAEFLHKNPEYAWTACDLGVCSEPGSRMETTPHYRARDDVRLAEAYILSIINRQIGHYLVRADYLRKCRVVERYDVTRGGTQEAQFFLPLAEGGGKLKHVPAALYQYNLYASEVGSPPTVDARVQYGMAFKRGCLNTIRSLDVSEERKEYLSGLCEVLDMKERLYGGSVAEDDEVGYICGWIERLFYPVPVLSEEMIQRVGTPTLLRVLDYLTLGIRNPYLDEIPAAARVIGYGAMGQVARVMLPLLEGTGYEPTVLWDRGAPGVSVTGQEVLLPDLDSLGVGDIVIFFPALPEVMEEMRLEFEKKDCRVIWREELRNYLAAACFREMLTESKFRWLPVNF